MDLITTHVNADFDALGSLVAAKKLYPDARLLHRELTEGELSLLTKLIANTKRVLTSHKRIDIIGRSSIPAVDVNRILAPGRGLY